MGTRTGRNGVNTESASRSGGRVLWDRSGCVHDSDGGNDFESALLSVVTS